MRERYKHKHIHPVRVKAIPEIVDDVHINPYAVNSLHPKDKWIATPEELINSTFFVVPKSPKGKLVPTSSVYGRAITTRRFLDPIRYADRFAATSIYTKGVGPSAEYYQKYMDSGTYGYSSDPIGFFGINDGLKEIEHSNNLIENGNRVQLVLGMVKLNPDKLIEFINNEWGDIHQGEAARKMLTDLELAAYINGDELIQLHRTGGFETRLSKIVATDGTVKLALKNAGRIWLEETKTDPDFLRSLMGDEADSTIDALRKLASFQRLTKFDFSVICMYLNQLLDTEVSNLIKIAESERYKNTNLLDTYQQPKDVDLSVYTCDWESVHYVNLYMLIRRTAPNLTNNLKTLLGAIWRHYC